jgi:voltage-gated potassium channel
MVLDHYGMKYVLVAGLSMLFATAVLVWHFERDAADSSIVDLEDALWWAITTMTTVGYGDTFPVTPEGRGMAVLLMITGISLFSYITANIAAFLVRPSGDKATNDPTLTDVMREIRVLEQRISELRARLDVEPERETESVR